MKSKEVSTMDFSVGISVIMATYNTETYILKEAVDSILNQTFRNFEFFIIDDGSTNGSDVYLDEISDSRVKIIRNSSNIGITKSLNIGLGLAKGKYIARMDADDVSLPERLEKEFSFMEAHPEVIVCGSREGLIINGEKIKTSNEAYEVCNMEEYKVKLLFVNPGPRHPTVMIRHEQLMEHNIRYNEELIHSQDYGLWEVISHYGKICEIDEVLLYRRKHNGQVSVAKRDIQIQCDKMTQKKLLSDLLDNVSDREVDFHYRHSTGYYPDAVISPEAEEWYDRLIQANKERQIYNQKKLVKQTILIKKQLVRQSFKPEMSLHERMCIIFRYLPVFESVRMILGIIKRSLLHHVPMRILRIHHLRLITL
jgi:glycosyltransferase involved in cell wall biosynthesis